MSYESPITTYWRKVQEDADNEVLRRVLELGVVVDEEELVKALQYDRDQYNKGYLDGCTDEASKIIHCKDCGYYRSKHRVCLGRPGEPVVERFPEDFCSKAVREMEGV